LVNCIAVKLVITYLFHSDIVLLSALANTLSLMSVFVFLKCSLYMLFIFIFWVPQVKDLENSVAELLDLHSDCNHRSTAIQSVANRYQPVEQVLTFPLSCVI